MNKRTFSFLGLLIISTVSSTQEHNHHHIHQPKPIVRSPEINDLHIMIDVPDRPSHEDRIGSPRTPRDIQRLKAKLVAATSIITALITGGIFLAIHLSKCN